MTRKRLQYPLNEFWVSIPYSKRDKRLGLGTRTMEGRRAEVVSPHVGELIEVIKKGDSYEVWGKYKEGELYTYVSIYPLDEVVAKGTIIQNEILGYTSANHIHIKTNVTKLDVDRPSKLKNGFRDPLACLYKYAHQDNHGNIPYCSPKINHIKVEQTWRQ